MVTDGARTNQFYYMSRVVFSFTLIALFFTICALFVGVTAVCTRVGSYLASLVTMVALVMQTVNCALMTCVPLTSISIPTFH
jgi:hypothetical protein